MVAPFPGQTPQQLPLRQLQVRTVVRLVLLTKKKEAHLSILSSTSPTGQDLTRALGFSPPQHVTRKDPHADSPWCAQQDTPDVG